MRAAFKIPRTSSSYRMMSWGFCVLKGMPTNHFSFVGTHFKTSWDSKGMAIPLALGHPIGARSTLLAGESKGDSVPFGRRHPMEGSALRGRKNPMKPAVSWHTILLARSSVLYLWRPWVAERGCSGQEQALSVSHRTGGFCVLPDEKPRSMLKAESTCSGLGGAVKWRGKAQRCLGVERHHRGSQRDIKPAAATLLSLATPQMKSPFLSAVSHSDNSKDRKLRIWQRAEKSFYPSPQA